MLSMQYVLLGVYSDIHGIQVCVYSNFSEHSHDHFVIDDLKGQNWNISFVSSTRQFVTEFFEPVKIF